MFLIDIIHRLPTYPSYRLSLATRCYAMKHIKMLPMDGKENQPRRINYVEQYNRHWDV